MVEKSVKCRKCRHLLFSHPNTALLNAHGVSCSVTSIRYINCATVQENNLWFLGETNLPNWINSLINDVNWTKGKIYCPNCHGRLGSFDFITGSKCQCANFILPPVHIVKCKVDSRDESK